MLEPTFKNELKRLGRQEEIDLRKYALDQATNCTMMDAHPKGVVERAEAYYKFLSAPIK